MATLAGDLTVRVGADLKGFDRGMGRMERRMHGFGRVASRAALGGVAALGGLGIAALKAAGNFEQSLNIFQAVSGATGREMKSVSALAKQLGADVKLPATSAKDAADAMSELAKGGMSVAEAMSAARGVLQLSAAAEISNAEAATIVSDNLRAFSMSARDAGKVSNLLAAAANATTADMGEMALALKQVASVGALLKMPIEDVSLGLSLLANNGLKGSDAGTSLKQMLLSLKPTTKDAAETIRELNVGAFDSHGKFIGLEAVIGKYREALSHLSQEQQIATLKTIFGSDAVRAAGLIFGSTSAQVEKMKTALGNQTAAADLAAARMKGFNGSMQALKSSLETLAISLGEKLIPAATQLVNWFNAHMPEIQRAIEAAMEGIGKALDAAGRAHERLRVVVEREWPRIQSAAQKVSDFYKQDVEPSFKDTNRKIDQDFLGLRSLVAGRLTGIAVNLKNAGLVWRDISGAAMAALRGDWDRAWMHLGNLVRDGLALAKSVMLSKFEEFYGLGFRLGRGIVGKIGEGLANVAQAVGAKLQAIRGAIADAAAAAYEWATGIGRQIVGGVLAGLGGLAGAVKDKISGAISSALSGIDIPGFSPPAHAAAEAIGRPLAQGVVDGWVAGSAALPTKMKETLRNAIEKARAVVSAARDKFGSVFDKLASKITGAFDAETEAHLTPAEKQIRDIERAQETERLAEAVQDASDAWMQAAMENADPAKVAELWRTYQDAVTEQQLAGLRVQAANERKEYESSRNLLKERLEGRLASIKAHFDKEGATVGSALGVIKALMASFAIDFKSAGDNLGKAFVIGLKAALIAAAKGSGRVKDVIRREAESIEARASGGPVRAGRAYVVGERGPELFAPRMNGTIVPNGANASGTGGQTVIQLMLDRRVLGQAVYDEFLARARVSGALFSATAGVTA